MSHNRLLTVGEAERRLDAMTLELAYAGHLADLLMEIASDYAGGTKGARRTLNHIAALGNALALHVRDAEIAVAVLRGGMDANGFKQERNDPHVA